MTTTPYAELIKRAATELNDAANLILDGLPDPDGAEPEDVDGPLGEIHDRLGMDFDAVFTAARDAGLTALDCLTPREVLADPIGAFATIWHSGFMVGACTQQLRDSDAAPAADDAGEA